MFQKVVKQRKVHTVHHETPLLMYCTEHSHSVISHVHPVLLLLLPLRAAAAAAAVAGAAAAGCAVLGLCQHSTDDCADVPRQQVLWLCVGGEAFDRAMFSPSCCRGPVAGPN